MSRFGKSNSRSLKNYRNFAKSLTLRHGNGEECAETLTDDLQNKKIISIQPTFQDDPELKQNVLDVPRNQTISQIRKSVHFISPAAIKKWAHPGDCLFEMALFIPENKIITAVNMTIMRVNNELKLGKKMKIVCREENSVRNGGQGCF